MSLFNIPAFNPLPPVSQCSLCILDWWPSLCYLRPSGSTEPTLRHDLLEHPREKAQSPDHQPVHRNDGPSDIRDWCSRCNPLEQMSHQFPRELRRAPAWFFFLWVWRYAYITTSSNHALPTLALREATINFPQKSLGQSPTHCTRPWFVYKAFFMQGK